MSKKSPKAVKATVSKPHIGMSVEYFGQRCTIRNVHAYPISRNGQVIDEGYQVTVEGRFGESATVNWTEVMPLVRVDATPKRKAVKR